ncbi:MAG: helix-turn-helix transcriptional regulator [Gemmatimonadales bacterium]|nr:helix-turn-helix transcriptional regulator [Gemmatimonadales bacterium]
MLLQGLTPRQRTVIRLVGAGRTSRQIADEMRLSWWTVRFHRKNIKHRLGLQTDLDMVRWGMLVDTLGYYDSTPEGKEDDTVSD